MTSSSSGVIESNTSAVAQHARELAALYAVTAAINLAFTETEALSGALRQVLPVLSLDSGRIYLADGQTGEFRLVAAEGDPALLDPTETTIQPGECLCGLAAEGGEPVSTRDATDPRLIRAACRQRGTGWALAAVPLMARERALGVMHVASRRLTPFGDTDIALLQSVGAQIGTAVENVRLREQARRADALATLIQEMHHRIKNNLQTVADLLSLEMSASPSPIARKSLRDSVSRIKSIAAVHDLLSSEQMRLTDITALASQVCDISLKHLVRPDRRVEAEISGPSIYLPSKQATALALVMNELIANALEHAFVLGRQRRLLQITLAQDGPQVIVTISDNGRGLPPQFDLDGSRGLGLRIARTLAEKDLAGTLRLENRPEGGSLATLIFYK
jgi:two-component system, sensor histidine kinase PdtaS